MRKSRIHSFRKVVPANSGVGTHDFSVDVDSSFTKIKGVGVKVISLGGLSDIDVVLKDKEETYINPTDSDYLSADKGVPPNHKYFRFLEEGISISSGQGLLFHVVTYADNPTDIVVKVSFELVR